VNQKMTHAADSLQHCGMRIVWDRCRKLCALIIRRYRQLQIKSDSLFAVATPFLRSCVLWSSDGTDSCKESQILYLQLPYHSSEVVCSDHQMVQTVAKKVRFFICSCHTIPQKLCALIIRRYRQLQRKSDFFICSCHTIPQKLCALIIRRYRLLQRKSDFLFAVATPFLRSCVLWSSDGTDSCKESQIFYLQLPHHSSVRFWRFITSDRHMMQEQCKDQMRASGELINAANHDPESLWKIFKGNKNLVIPVWSHK
jgi:hypothetical protein